MPDGSWLNRLPAFPAVRLPACLLASVWLVSACNWVDSAGSSSSPNQPPQVSVTSAGTVADAIAPGMPAGAGDRPLDDAPTAGEAPLTLAVLEEGSVSVSAAAEDADGSIRSVRWEETPVDEGAIEACSGIDGFDPARVAASLEAACSVAGCAPTVENPVVQGASTDAVPDTESPASSEVALAAEFAVSMPILQSPVGVTYEIIATDDRGGVTAMPVTLCLVAVNEAPEAVDDSFSVLEGTVLEVSAGTLNLLSNDTDDIDSSNEPLSVLSDPVNPPVAADVFELREDGGFTYAFTGANLASDIVDRFDYAITDGSFTSTATATIRIVQRDDPPTLDAPLPVLEAVEGIEFEADLAPFFSDPEGADLAFDILDGDLPPSGELVLSPLGELAGIPAANDAGDYDVILSASDGTLNAEAGLALSVLPNERVETSAIPDRVARVARPVRFGVARYFSDPEGVALVYRLAARGVSLNLTIDTRSGVVTGFVTEAGTYELRVTASDGFTPPVAAAIELIVDE